MTQAPILFSLPDNWRLHLQSELDAPYMQQLAKFLAHEMQQDKIIYPGVDKVFAAFEATAFDNVKVVIIGQDPYHGEGQAHGLSFSVPQGVKPPPSLMNIFKELHADLHLPVSRNGCLQSWAQQGVLLLNSVLTVEAGLAASHQGKGWEHFTDQVIAQLNEKKEHLVFMLWGNYAQRKGVIIDRHKHFVLEAAHPSPFSAHRGFLGCRHFSKANAYLIDQGFSAIDWRL